MHLTALLCTVHLTALLQLCSPESHALRNNAQMSFQTLPLSIQRLYSMDTTANGSKGLPPTTQKKAFFPQLATQQKFSPFLCLIPFKGFLQIQNKNQWFCLGLCIPLQPEYPIPVTWLPLVCLFLQFPSFFPPVLVLSVPNFSPLGLGTEISK